MALWQDTDIKRINSKKSLFLSHSRSSTFSHSHEDRKAENSQSRKDASIKPDFMSFPLATTRLVRKGDSACCLQKTEEANLSTSLKTA